MNGIFSAGVFSKITAFAVALTPVAVSIKYCDCRFILAHAIDQGVRALGIEIWVRFVIRLSNLSSELRYFASTSSQYTKTAKNGT